MGFTSVCGMKKEAIVCLLIREALFANHSEEPNNRANDGRFNLSDEEWMEVYQELVAQTIEEIPCEWVLEHLSVPDPVRGRWASCRINQVAYFYRLLQEQSELCSLMKDHGIPMAILKGTAAAMYYPDPSARTMGDIDFLVAQEDYERAFQLMRDHGYHLMYEEDHADHHMTLGKDGFTYEIHRKPAGLPHGAEGNYLMCLIREGLQKAEETEIESCRIPVLPEICNGIVLLLHIVQHLRSGLGLRQIMDWMMYVNQALHDDRWYGGMQPILAKAGLEILAKSVTRMCQLYLGLDEQEITWCAEVDDLVCTNLMHFILQQGNFGRKAITEDRGVKIVGEVHNPLQLFRLLQERGQKNWELAKKYPVLNHAAWIYMVCRYAQKSMHRKSPIKTLLSDVKAGKERRDLFDQLGIYQK